MLVLGRQLGENIVLICANGDIIRVGFEKRSGTSISVHIGASPNVRILRGELYDEIERQKADDRRNS